MGCTGIGHAPICSSSWRLPCDSAIARGSRAARAGVAASISTIRHGVVRKSCAASARPTGPPPTMAMSNGSGLGVGLWLGLVLGLVLVLGVGVTVLVIRSFLAGLGSLGRVCCIGRGALPQHGIRA